MSDETGSTPTLEHLLESAGVPRHLSDEQMDTARRFDLRLEAEPGTGPAVTDPPPPGDTGGEGGSEGDENQFDLETFDPSNPPDGLDAAGLEIVKGFQADYTTKRQADAEARRTAEQSQAIVDGLRNPETAPEFLRILGVPEDKILEAYGYTVEGGQQELDPTLVDPDERIDQLEGRLQQEAQARQQRDIVEGEANHIESELDALEADLGRKFDAEEVSILTTYSRVHPDQLGNPDVQAAFKQLQGVLQKRQEEWLKTKKVTSRPVVPGTPGGKAPDPSTPEGRQAIAEHAAAQARDSAS